MIGTKLTATGRLVDTAELMLVHLDLKSGQLIPAHDHPGQEVFFTVVRGEIEVTLGGEEKHHLTPGSVLHFAGEASIGAKALTESEAFVYLIHRRG